MGEVLSQRQGKPLKLYPFSLSSAERNYYVGDQELLPVKLALEEWRHWLEGPKEPFIILTNHWNLEYIRTARRLNTLQARWAFLHQVRLHADLSGEVPVHRAPIIPSSRVVGPVVWDVDVDICQALEGARTPELAS